MNYTDVYARYIRPLPVAERLQLISLIAQGVETDCREIEALPLANIMEFEGIAKGAWNGIDAQAYLQKLRDEWENRGE